MAPRFVITVTVAAALSAPAGAPSALARSAVELGVRADSTPTTTQVTVTRPDGFAWLETLLGASAGGGLVILAAAGLSRRRRMTSSPVRAAVADPERPAQDRAA